MSEKSKASTLAALALAGVVAVTSPGPAVSQDVQPQATTTTAQATNQQAQGVRYLDFTTRNDGWAASQTAAIIGSRDRKIVIISYSDNPTTRAIYDTAVQFTRPPQSLPVFGVVRAPQHPTQPNPNGFDIYINGVPLGEVPNPDSAYSRTQFFALLMNNIKRDYYAAATAQTDPIGVTGTAMAYNAGGQKSSSGGSGTGTGTGSATGSSGGSSGSGEGSAGGKGSTEIAAVVFNPDL